MEMFNPKRNLKLTRKQCKHKIIGTQTNLVHTGKLIDNLLLIIKNVMVIVAGYGHGDTSSNPGPDWLHFT